MKRSAGSPRLFCWSAPSDAKTILGRLQGHYDYGDGRKLEDKHFMSFSARNCNFPQPKYAVWFLSQYRRWGMLASAPDYEISDEGDSRVVEESA